MLATLKEVLEIANQRETAIPHFNIDNIDGIEAVMEAADTENYPVILSIGQGAINAGNLWYLADAVQRAANDSKVPVVLHLDHGVSYEQTVVCLRAGFTSVMYDGSHHPFEENVRESLAVIRSAHAVGVSVECELGAIGGVEDGMSHDHLNLVDVGEVERFCAQVDCDALAIGIGFGVSVPAFQCLFVNVAPHHMRGTATSTYLTSFDFGMGIGMLSAGFIATRANLATAYGVGAVCCLLSLFVYIRLVKASYERNKLIS